MLDANNLFAYLIELLNDLNLMFDENEIIELNKTYNELFNFDFKMQQKKIFEIFMIRFIIVIVSMIFLDAQLIVIIKFKLIKRLRDETRHFVFCKSFKTFVDEIKNVDLLHHHEFYSSNIKIDHVYVIFYSLSKKIKT